MGVSRSKKYVFFGNFGYVLNGWFLNLHYTKNKVFH